MTGGTGPTTDEMKERVEEADDESSGDPRWYVVVDETGEYHRSIRYEFEAPEDMAPDIARRIASQYVPDDVEVVEESDPELVDSMHRSLIDGGRVPDAD